jgi:type I restriction enzyme S subunit
LIRPDHTESRSDFLEYALKSAATQAQIDVLCTTNTQKNISMRDIPILVVCVAPLPQQCTIAAFLDRETSRIDALVAKKERLIELLQERRTVLITNAVTKGLDPAVPMKDSGVEWLGEIPAHWEFKRLSLLLKDRPRNGVSPTIGPEGVTPTFSTAAVSDGVVMIHGNIKYTTISVREARPFLVLQGDILLLRGSGSRALVGRAGIVTSQPPEGCIYPDILIRLTV